MEKWANKLLKWYGENKRALPWRDSRDPYKIWLSEVILQQTRVNQGTGYYLRFIEKYPTVSRLAAASEDDVLKLWQGLGYYSRARNMHHTARYIMQSLGGKFPRKYKDISALQGIGNYTAAAIASFAYNLPYAVLDGNVMRVYSRLLGIAEPIDRGAVKKKLQQVADDFLAQDDSAAYNQAVMELGAIVCLPKNPNCRDCPIQVHCYAYAHQLTDKLPVKQRKTKKKERFLNYLVLQSGNKIVLRKRFRGDIWQGLYDFPSIETSSAVSCQYLTTTSQWQNIFGKRKVNIQSVSGEYRHILTHRTLLATFIRIKAGKQAIVLPEACEWINLHKLPDYAVPRLIERYISAHL